MASVCGPCRWSVCPLRGSFRLASSASFPHHWRRLVLFSVSQQSFRRFVFNLFDWFFWFLCLISVFVSYSMSGSINVDVLIVWWLEWFVHFLCVLFFISSINWLIDFFFSTSLLPPTTGCILSSSPSSSSPSDLFVFRGTYSPLSFQCKPFDTEPFFAIFGFLFFLFFSLLHQTKSFFSTGKAPVLFAEKAAIYTNPQSFRIWSLVALSGVLFA